MIFDFGPSVEVITEMNYSVFLFFLSYLCLLWQILPTAYWGRISKEEIAKTPNLSVYYPSIPSIISVILRFMGGILVVFILFFLSLHILNSSGFLSDEFFDNYSIWFLLIIVLTIHALVCHVGVAIYHQLDPETVEFIKQTILVILITLNS